MLIFGMMALGSGSGSEKTEIVASEDVSSVKEDDDSKTDASAEAVDDASMEASDEKADEETESSDVTIEEQVLFEENGLKVTATEYVSDSIWGDGIKILLENDGPEDVGLVCNALIVNDYMITDLFSSTIAAGKKADETLYLSSSGLKAAGIENVGKIEVYFHTFDPDTYMTINDFDCITIQTSAYDTMDTEPNDAGQELYNENGGNPSLDGYYNTANKGHTVFAQVFDGMDTIFKIANAKTDANDKPLEEIKILSYSVSVK